MAGMTDARVRHDFKNQLAIIRGFAELLVTGAPSGDPRLPDFAEIHRAANVALALLERLYPSSGDGAGRAGG